MSSKITDLDECLDPQDDDELVVHDEDANDTRKLLIATLLGLTLRTVNIQTFTGDGTYTPTEGMLFCVVILTGAGGGGGGSDTNGSNAIVAVGAGGGAGGTQISVFTAADIGASKAVVVGVGGPGGSQTGGTAGTNGEDSTFGGSMMTAPGGVGGAGSGASTVTFMDPDGSAGGAPTGADVNIAGGAGDDGIAGSVDGTTDLMMALSGRGGGSFWGGGGRARGATEINLATDVSRSGQAGVAKGSGGGGAATLTTGNGSDGGAGADGICVVIEFVGA